MLAKANRVRSGREFRATYTHGKSFAASSLVLYVRSLRSDDVQFGFSISKKLGGSVVRNRIKRRLREACRAALADLKPGHMLVFVGRKRLVEMPYSELRSTVVSLAHRAKLVREAPEDAPCAES